MSDTMRTAFRLGYEDRDASGLLRTEQLYRHGLANKIAWRIGWEVANLITSRPLRTSKSSAPTGSPDPDGK